MGYLGYEHDIIILDNYNCNKAVKIKQLLQIQTPPPSPKILHRGLLAIISTINRYKEKTKNKLKLNNEAVLINRATQNNDQGYANRVKLLCRVCF